MGQSNLMTCHNDTEAFKMEVSGYLKQHGKEHLHKNIYFVEQYTIGLSFNEINLPIDFLLNEMFEWAVPIAVTITPSTPLHSVLIFCLRFNRQKQENNYFLVMYWYKNNIGEINLILSLIVSQKFCKTSVFIRS